MEQLLWNEDATVPVRLSDRLQVHDEALSFLARNIYRCRLEENHAAPPGLKINARARSVGGFTIGRASISTAVGGRSWRQAADIASDGRDAFCVYFSLRGGLEVSQFGRTQEVAAGSYSFLSICEPATCGHRQGGDYDALSFLMPRDYVDQRLPHSEKLCARRYDAGRGLHGLVIETFSVFEKNAWQATDDEFKNSARILGSLVLLALGGSADRCARAIWRE